MSKHSLDNDFGFQNRIDNFRISVVDAFRDVKQTAFGGGWSKHEETRALSELQEGLDVLNLWREKNSTIEDEKLAVVPDGMVAVDEDDLAVVLDLARQEGITTIQQENLIHDLWEKLEDNEDE